MDWISRIMVYLGSALMVINIVRYFRYARKLKRIERIGKSKILLYVPLVLLIMFLAGYLAVGIFGDPDIIMSGILFGGSVYVFMFLLMTYSITDRVIENESAQKAKFDEMKSDLDSMTKNSIAVFSVNLTKDLIEEIDGTDLYDEDRGEKSFSRFVENRSKYTVYREDPGTIYAEDLIRQFKEGHDTIYRIFLTRRQNGKLGFIRFKASMAEQPSTGDIIAFITERDWNNEMVNKAILDGALAEQYCLIAFVVNGQYNLVMNGYTSKEKGGILPAKETGSYTDYIKNELMPRVRATEEQYKIVNENLCLDCVCRNLAENSIPDVNIEIEDGGEIFYKRFSFFPVNAEANFFIMLVSDTTAIHEERTEQNRKLEDALADARRANDAKTRFFSAMSHDIRTPMNAIIGFTDIAKNCDDPEKVKEYLGKIESSGNYMLDIVNDVLEMSRIESGNTKLDIKRTDLSEAFKKLYDVFSSQMAGKGLDFTTDLSGVKNRFVKCDSKVLGRVLMNLVSNAYKYTPEGGSVKVTVTQDNDDGKSADYGICVSDTGIGMTEEFAKKIFTPFEREQSELVGQIQGTGLGLAITKRMTDLMGGEINVTSAPGEGTTFTLRFRFDYSEEDAPAVVLPSKKTDRAEAPRRILVADDNRINREIARLVLQSGGYTVEEAEDGKQAYDMIAGSEDGYFDLLLTDIQMPVMDGYESARAVRALGGVKSKMPIIALTANAFAEDKSEDSTECMNGYVLKPFNREDLLAEIAKLLTEKE
ncbi:MAG: response regulator [Clostridia bacterium]|nr:response regulator [Clostridia bacterium]